MVSTSSISTPLMPDMSKVKDIVTTYDDLLASAIEVARVGSSVINIYNTVPPDDIDYLVLVYNKLDFVSTAKELGFEEDCSYSLKLSSKFISIRNGDINLIVTKDLI